MIASISVDIIAGISENCQHAVDKFIYYYFENTYLVACRQIDLLMHIPSNNCCWYWGLYISPNVEVIDCKHLGSSRFRTCFLDSYICNIAKTHTVWHMLLFSLLSRAPSPYSSPFSMVFASVPFIVAIPFRSGSHFFYGIFFCSGYPHFCYCLRPSSVYCRRTDTLCIPVSAIATCSCLHKSH